MASYVKILKSSGLIGLVQIFQLLFGVIRNKVIATTLGASGFGIWGLFQTYIEMVSSFSTLGIDQSGVREIAKHKENPRIQHKIIFIFTRTVLYLSLIITLLSILFSKQISSSLFETDKYYYEIIIVSFVILFNGIVKGQRAILNGLRDLRGLALSQIFGSVAGTLSTIALVLFLGLKGIPVYLFAIGLLATIFSSLQVNKLNIEKQEPTFLEYRYEVSKLIKLGFGFCGSAIVATLFTYLSRIYLNETFDLSTVGVYQASWTISNMYIGIILSAMGVDFMPRIMDVVNNNRQLSALINEQMEIGLLITSIGIVFILLFSPIILTILYSQEFVSGSGIIQWQVLGVALRVLGFPFSYSIMAKNKPHLYLIAQIIFFSTDYLLIIIFSKLYGLSGLGINYFVAYILYLVITWTMCNKLFGFNPTRLLRKIFLISTFFITIAWSIASFLTGSILLILGSILLITMAFWINNYLKRYMGISLSNFLSKKFRK